MKLQKKSSYLMNSRHFVEVYAKKLVLQNIEKAILCFSPAMATRLQASYKAKRIYSLGACWDIYQTHKSLVVSQFGMGAPAALLQWEYLKTFQIPVVFSLGAMASFDKKLKLGDKLFIQKAYEDIFSASNFQKDPMKQILKNPKQIAKKIKKQAVKNSFKKESDKLIKDLCLLPVTSLSCGKPYNITKELYPFYMSLPLSGLEMEASTLMSASKKDKIPLFCLALVSDFLSDKVWEMGFSHKTFKNNFFSLLEKLLYYQMD